MHDKDAALFWNHGSKMHQLKLFDLSSVGMAVKIPAGLESLIIAKNYILQNVTLRLGTKQVVTEAVVFAVKKNRARNNMGSSSCTTNFCGGKRRNPPVCF